MSDPEALDVLVIDGQIVLDDAFNPVLVSEADSLAQDIKHMMIEKGYLTRLIGQRNQNAIDNELLKLQIDIEEDERVVPGTAKTQYNGGQIIITAEHEKNAIQVILP